MRKRRTILALVAFAGLAVGLLLRPDGVDERAALRRAFPGLVFSEKRGSPPHYRAAGGEVAFNSFDVAPGIRGYAGPLKTLVLLGPDGRIRGLRLLEHRETRNYVHYLETAAYLDRYVGKSVADAFVADRDIDGITRATVSVEALARTVRESSRRVASNVYGMEVREGPPSASGAWWPGPVYAALVAAAAAGYLLTRRDPSRRRVRDGVLVAAVLVTGIVLSAPFSVLHLYNLLLLRPSTSLLWAVVAGTTLLSLVLAGRAYCGWLCPFGGLSEFIGRLPVRKWSLSPRQDGRWRELKYVLLGLSAAVVLLTGRPDHGNVETSVTLFSRHGTIAAWGLVGLSLLLSLRVPRFWCRYLCPAGAFAALFSRTDRSYPGRPDCPMGNPPDPEPGECIRCNRCYGKQQ
jgi:hypothetical protein